jgi:hypothetical protein
MLEEEVMILPPREQHLFHLSNPVTGEYTKMNQYVNPLKMEMNGDGNILFKYSYTNGSSMTFSDSLML